MADLFVLLVEDWLLGLSLKFYMDEYFISMSGVSSSGVERWHVGEFDARTLHRC